MTTSLQLLLLHPQRQYQLQCNIHGLVVPVHVLLAQARLLYMRLLISQWMMRMMKEYQPLPFLLRL